MSVDTPVASLDGRSMPRWRVAGHGVVLVAFALIAAVALAYLVSKELWYVALALMLVGPGLVVLHRRPMHAVTAWLLLGPLVAVTDSGVVRKVFWMSHRMLPLAAVAIVIASSMLGIVRRRLPRLGWPELLMAGYAIATGLSIAYRSTTPMATAVRAYDLILVPMFLYLLVRLLQPGDEDLRRIMPAVVFVVLSQSLLGLLQWNAPGLVPHEWMGKAGARTTGSLRSPELFGVTLLFCAMLFLHRGMQGRRAMHRVSSVVLFTVALFLVFMSFSRSVWGAGLLALVGCLVVYRRSLWWFPALTVAVLVTVVAAGLLSEQVEFAQQRLNSEQSEESALSRLPVVYASVRMFQARPLVGWGYERFDDFDLQFQGRVGNLYVPDKDHASHNLYLTTLAEQGLVGLLLFMGPLLYWLGRTRRGLASLPATGLVSRPLLWILWLSIAVQFIVSNTYRMQIPFGLGLWWLSLGLVASLIGRHSPLVESGRMPARDGMGGPSSTAARP